MVVCNTIALIMKMRLLMEPTPYKGFLNYCTYVDTDRFFVMLTSVIDSFQVFDVAYMLVIKTGPVYADVQTVVMLFYRQAFDYRYKGYEAVISVLIFGMIMPVTLIQLFLQKKIKGVAQLGIKR